MSRLSRFLRNAFGHRKAQVTIKQSGVVVATRNNGDRYWEQRKALKYTRHVIKLVNTFEKEAQSAIDIGAWKTPIIEEFDWIRERDALDILKPYSSATVRGIQQDFFTFAPGEKYDLVLCLQVLEHLENPGDFARKLFETGKSVIVSVPFNWPAGACEHHCQDPVDQDKLLEWTGRKPVYSAIINEGPHPCSDRLIAYYRDDPLSAEEAASLAA